MIMKLVVRREFLILNDMRYLVAQQLTTKKGKRKKKIMFRDLTDKMKKAKIIKLI
jgi:hypothetical protein